MDLLTNPLTDFYQLHLPQHLVKLMEWLLTVVKAANQYKQRPATHLFIFMISPERRPYALPVQCVSCASLKCSELRCLTTELVKEMVKRGMKTGVSHKHTYIHLHAYACYVELLDQFTIVVFLLLHAGSVSNGQFNSLGSEGYTCPLSILEIKANVRRKYSKVRQSVMMAMLKPVHKCS